jgi:DNA-binding transcriptional regulator LsrR (DeoR family)
MSVAQRRAKEAEVRESFIEEYNHFRHYGYTTQQIADRLGLQLTTVQEKVRKLKLEKIYTTEEKSVLAALERKIASGLPFCAANLPTENLDGQQLRVIMSTAKAQGRIRAIGQTKIGHVKLVLWIGAEHETPTREENVA